MKRAINIIKSTLLMVVILASASCSDYLEKSPDMGIDESDIYKDFESIRGYFDNCYDKLDQLISYNETGNGRTHNSAISDECASLYNFTPTATINSGNWSGDNITAYEVGTASGNGGTSIYRAYQCVRIATRVIDNIDQVTNITDEQKTQLLGQAYFMRAWFYFQLIKRYGGMPILDQVFVGGGDDDLPRQTYHGSHDWMMTDLEAAIERLPNEWDASNVGRVTKIAAMAFKSVALLYDASPLMQNGLDETTQQSYDKTRATLAAKAAQELITLMENTTRYYSASPKYLMDDYDDSTESEDLGYSLYKNLFYWDKGIYGFEQPEYLWYNRTTANAVGTTMKTHWLPAEITSGTGNYAIVFNAPTQNMVDLFEYKGSDGLYYPIDDLTNSGYADANMYTNRDPRFTNNILYPGETWGVDSSGSSIEISLYSGGAMLNTLLSSSFSNKRESTGYMCKKFIWPTANQYQNEYTLYRFISVYIRAAEIYLNYAEAAFEATGDANTPADGCTLKPIDALNRIRNRGGITNLPDSYASDPTKFRAAYRRERAVELMFEDKRWWDLRRWMIAEEIFKSEKPIYNVVIENKKPTGRVANSVEVRGFTNRNYWYPFSLTDVASMNNLKQNPGW